MEIKGDTKVLRSEVPTAFHQDAELFADRPAQNEVLGPSKVQLYKPNRKQRRAQAAVARSKKP